MVVDADGHDDQRPHLHVAAGAGHRHDRFRHRPLGEPCAAERGREIAQRAAYYLLFGLFVISALRELGFSLSVLLGAAGILSVAIGFASLFFAFNLISGLFLIGERPFSVGDVIKINETTGEVLSIDLLSVKLRTFDNLYVRIPNETVIKSEVTTLTKFPIRRLDLKLNIAYKEDVERVRTLLLRLAAAHPLALEEPKPVFVLQDIGEGALHVQFLVWVMREQLLELQNGLQADIRRAFIEQGIDTPQPKMTVEIAGPAQSRLYDSAAGEMNKYTGRRRVAVGPCVQAVLLPNGVSRCAWVLVRGLR